MAIPPVLETFQKSSQNGKDIDNHEGTETRRKNSLVFHTTGVKWFFPGSLCLRASVVKAFSFLLWMRKNDSTIKSIETSRFESDRGK
jgi:hypothetical protein